MPAGVRVDDLADLESAVSPLAVANLHAQKEMLAGLSAAFEASGRSIEEVATKLGVSVPVAQSALRGERNLTLSECRELAYAVHAFVRHQVTPVSWLVRMHPSWSSGLWQTAPKFEVTKNRVAADG